MSVAHQLRLTQDPRYLDTTVKSGDKIFAPTWKMVMGVKGGRTTEEEYTQQYYDMMRASYRQNTEGWNDILALDEIILACYCKPDSFCHRYLLKDMLVKCGAEYSGEVRRVEDLASRNF
ncbi:hypothetical protein CMI38_04885 [Candidatus Pacearchaeota archaeon]|nr:hypothetical protein [Candidatus Pacearchaeota archaeon]